MAENPVGVVTDDGTLKVVVDVLEEHVDLEMHGSFEKRSLFEILTRAASEGDSIEHTSQGLEDVPTGNDIRYHLSKVRTVEEVEAQLNGALKARIPARIRKGRQKVSIDLNLIPYYGIPSEEEQPYIYRSQAKAGTCSFYAYATLYVIAKGKRITLALHAVENTERLVSVITRLLAQAAELNLRIKRLYLDRGFYCVPVIRWLQACGIPFVMPVVVRGKQHGTREIINRKRTHRTRYTMQSPNYGSVSFDIWVVGTYQMGKRGQHGVEYIAFAVYGIQLAIRALPDDYRRRFGIETSYRLKNLSRIRTATKNPAIRLLFVGIAFLLVNLWVFIVWTYVSRPRKGARLLYPQCFPFKTMLQFLRQAVERKYHVKTQIYLPPDDHL